MLGVKFLAPEQGYVNSVSWDVSYILNNKKLALQVNDQTLHALLLRI